MLHEEFNKIDLIWQEEHSKNESWFTTTAYERLKIPLNNVWYMRSNQIF